MPTVRLRQLGDARIDVLTDDELPNLCGQLGIDGIIDVHTHFMPDAVMRSVWAYFDDAGTNYGVDWPIEYRWHDDARLEHLRAMGVRGFSSLVYAHKPGMAEWLSEWALDFAERVPDCIPTATFFPEAAATDYVTRAVGRGAQLFKVHLQVGDFDPRDELLDGVWALLSEARVPVLVHCGGAPLPGRFTGPGPIGEVLSRFPELPVIVAHLGAGEYGQFLDLCESRAHTWLDTTMALTGFMQRLDPFPSDRLPQLRDLSGQGKVLFGSDFPNIPYRYAHQVEVLIDHRLDMRQVLWEAPKSLFGSR